MPLSDYDPIIQSAAQEWNLDPTLLKSVVAQESSGDPGAVSKAGAVGLSGLMPATAQGMGVTDLSDPVQQIYAGARYLSEGLDKEGSPQGALLYYHGGPDWRSKYGAESAAYVPAVTAHYQQFSAAQPAATPATATGEAAPTKSPAQMSDTDFLKATGGGTSAPAPESDADFLARTGGSAPTPAAAAAPSSQDFEPVTGAPVTPDQLARGQKVEAAVANTASAAVQGAKEGFGSGPLGMSPQTDQSLVNAGVFNGPNEYNPLKSINRAIVTPLATAGDLALRTGGALVGAYQHGVAQAGQEVGAPLLGRDLAALPEAFPTGDTGGGTAIPHPTAATEAPANPLMAEISPAAHDALDAPLPAAFRDNPLAPGVSGTPATPTPMVTLQAGDRTLQIPARPGTPIPAAPSSPNPLVAAPEAPLGAPSTPTGAPGPQSVGAAASRDISPPSAIEMTPAQEQAYRSTAEGQKLLEPQQPGVADPNIYVPGVTPNAAEIEQSVNTARELKALNVTAPEVSQEAKNIAAENNDTRQRYFSSIAGSPVDVQNAIAARSAQAEQDLATAFGNKKPTDAQPVVDTIQGILTNPRDSENTAVQQYVKPLLGRLMNDDGTLKSDPEQLYGLREDIARMQSKAAKAETPTLDHVNGQLQDIKGALDGVIEQGAPGYQQYLDNFSAASRPIETMQALQELEPKLYDAQNRMGYNKVQTMMRQIVDSRQSPGLNPFKSIPDETMGQLWNLRDDLRRSASAQELARAPGSDTVQNAWDAVKGVGKNAANVAAHGAILAHTGPVGNLAYSALRSAVSSGSEKRAAAKATARGMELLRPKTQLRNPLQTP